MFLPGDGNGNNDSRCTGRTRGGKTGENGVWELSWGWWKPVRRGKKVRQQRPLTVDRMQNVVKSLAKRSDAQVDCWVGGYGCKGEASQQNRIAAGGGVGLRLLILRISRFCNWLKEKVCQSQVSLHLLTNAAPSRSDQPQMLKSFAIPIMSWMFGTHHPGEVELDCNKLMAHCRNRRNISAIWTNCVWINSQVIQRQLNGNFLTGFDRTGLEGSKNA